MSVMQEGFRLRSFKAAAQGGFTVVELSVTVAVMLILVALLFSGIKVIRQNAQQVVCAANLRQVGLALRYYATDHDGRLPGPLWTMQTAWYGQGQAASIGTFLAPYLGLPELTSGSQRAKVLTCPSWKTTMKGNDSGQLYQVPSFGDVEVTSGIKVTIYGFPPWRERRDRSLSCMRASPGRLHLWRSGNLTKRRPRQAPPTPDYPR